jgi:hypothetical protein
MVAILVRNLGMIRMLTASCQTFAVTDRLRLPSQFYPY